MSTPQHAIEFELTDFDTARQALDALPPGLEALPTLTPEYWQQRRRKPLPSDRAMTGATLDWLMSLPGALRPLAMCDRFPRAANALAEAWNGPERMVLLDNLLTDCRGGRRGFPPEVASELRALHQAAQPETQVQRGTVG